MGSMEKGSVHYCCVAKGGTILQSYDNNNGKLSNVGDLETEKLAALCLENVPQYHRWYSQTMNKMTYCCLMEDGFVYLAIAEHGLRNQPLIRFLEHYRDEFKKLSKRGSNSRLSWKGKGKGKGNMSNANNLQEQLVPIVRQLITSLQNVGGQSSNGKPSSSPCGSGYREEVVEGSSSTKAPLLGNKAGKHEKRSKEHVIAIELEQQCCRSAERGGLRVDSGSDDTASVPMQKEMNAARRRPSSQTVKTKWCRLVRLVLAVDALVCIILLIIWLVICKGIQCIR